MQQDVAVSNNQPSGSVRPTYTTPSCDDELTGSELMLGFSFGDSSERILCKLKAQQNNAMRLRIDIWSGHSFRCDRYLKQPLRISDVPSIRERIKVLFTGLQRQTNPVDAQLNSECYGLRSEPLAAIVSGSEYPTIPIALPTELYFIAEGVDVFGIPMQAGFEFGHNPNTAITYLLARLKKSDASIVRFGNFSFYDSWYLENVSFQSYKPTSIDKLELIRKKAIGFFENIRSHYPGAISQSSGWDLILTRPESVISMKFNEAEGTFTILATPGAKSVTDAQLVDTFKWVASHRVGASR
jgi:hypothetical protein